MISPTLSSVTLDSTHFSLGRYVCEDMDMRRGVARKVICHLAQNINDHMISTCYDMTWSRDEKDLGPWLLWKETSIIISSPLFCPPCLSSLLPLLKHGCLKSNDVLHLLDILITATGEGKHMPSLIM